MALMGWAVPIPASLGAEEKGCWLGWEGASWLRSEAERKGGRSDLSQAGHGKGAKLRTGTLGAGNPSFSRAGPPALTAPPSLVCLDSQTSKQP